MLISMTNFHIYSGLNGFELVSQQLISMNNFHIVTLMASN